MFDFLSALDYLYIGLIVIGALVMTRLVKVLVVQDFYRSWVHLIKPSLAVVLLVLVYVSVTYGYSKTKRVWDNLAYINSYHPGDSLMAWALSDKVSTTADQSDQNFQKLMELRKAWPVALIGTFEDTTTVSVRLKDVNANPMVLQRIVDTYWDKQDSVWQDSVRYIADLQAFHIIDSAKDEIARLNQSVLMLDSVYSMKIKTWLVTDSLRVQFVNQ